MSKCYEEMLELVKGIADSEKRAKIINEYLDLNPDCQGGYTLQEIGVLLGVTRERVRQLESNALKKIKHPKVRKLIEPFLSS